MHPTNRLDPSNGRMQVLNAFAPDVDLPSAESSPNKNTVGFLSEHPGIVLLFGLFAGGVLGWLTSRRS